jgi:hypothetical protein
VGARAGAAARTFDWDWQSIGTGTGQGTFTAGIGPVGRGTKRGSPRANVESAKKATIAIASPPRIFEKYHRFEARIMKQITR